MSSRYASGPKGVVGLVKPTYRPGSLEETIRLLPEGIGVIPMHAGVTQGTTQEFIAVLDVAAARVAELAALGVDLVYVEGAPPPMLLGYPADHELAGRLTREHGVLVSLASIALVEALKALSIQRLVAVFYTPDDQCAAFAQYLSDAGFEVLEWITLSAPFSQADRITADEVLVASTSLYQRHPEADGIYLFGGAWRVLPIIELMERELRTKVAAGIQVSIWNIMRLLGVREPIHGYGTLLSDHL